MWDMDYVRPGDVVTSFEAWVHIFHRDPKMVIWWMTFLALVWAIWRFKNKNIFQHKTFDEGGWFELWRFDLA